MYTKSQYEGSYYGGNNALAQAHTSAQDLAEAGGNWDGMFSAGKESGMNKANLRGSSAGGRRVRPMTAKVNKNGMK